MKVAKFGGTSLADARQILKVVNIVKSDSARRIVVVSAPGKRHRKDTKVTDLLIALAKAVLAGKPFENELAAVVAAVRARSSRSWAWTRASSRRSRTDLRRRIQGRGRP